MQAWRIFAVNLILGDSAAQSRRRGNDLRDRSRQRQTSAHTAPSDRFAKRRE
jgi:hypothetical protein